MPKRILSDVHPGQTWRDRDKRMLSGERRVRVIFVTGPANSFVEYRSVFPSGDMSGPVMRSRYERFQRAFDLVSAPVASREEHQ